MKYLRLPAMVGLGLMGLMQAGMADDYTYLFNPATMQVGQTVGEYLVVKDKCPTKQPCVATERLKYVTAEAGRTGRLEIPVNAGSDFEISFNIYSNGVNNLTITLYLSDGNSLPLDFGYQYGGQWLSVLGVGGVGLNWKVGVNDFRLISEQGTLKINANDTIANVGDIKLSGTITRIVISKIDDNDTEQDYLFEIRTRGIQSGGNQTGGDFETGKQTGIQQCQKDPASCSITVTPTGDFESGKQAGIQQCLKDPASCSITVTPNVDPNLCKQTAIEQCQKDPASCGITTTNGTTGGTHATFNPCTRELYIPLVDVPGEFGVMKAYEVYLVQQPSTFTFNLDMNRLKVVP